ncbi:MAG: hypothetical protein ACUVRV_08390 [Cyanobacteriota bacterium]
MESSTTQVNHALRIEICGFYRQFQGIEQNTSISIRNIHTMLQSHWLHLYLMCAITPFRIPESLLSNESKILRGEGFQLKQLGAAHQSSIDFKIRILSGRSN